MSDTTTMDPKVLDQMRRTRNIGIMAHIDAGNHVTDCFFLHR